MSKRDLHWEARTKRRVLPGGKVIPASPVFFFWSPSWYGARKQAALYLHRDPDEIRVQRYSGIYDNVEPPF